MPWGNDPVLTQPPLEVIKDALADWERKSIALAEAKEAESAARLKAFKLAFPQPKEGTNTYNLSNGYVLKAQHKISRKFIVPEGFEGPHPEKSATILDAVEHLEKELKLASNQGGFIAERMIKYDAKLADGEYKKLPDDLRKITDHYVSSSEGTPTLSIVAPKE